MASHEEIFTRIYETNAWKGQESVSGPSSGLERTRTLREGLVEIFKKYEITSILDGPCGDFVWMKEIMPIEGLSYTGLDIVEPMIASNTEKYAGDSVRFDCVSLVEGPLPQAELVFSRDFLFHMSYGDIAQYFRNVRSASTRFFMTTSHINKTDFENRDIRTGGWRWFDLFQAPFDFPETYVEKVIDGGGDRHMYMWRIEDIAPALERFEAAHLPDQDGL